MTSADIIHQYLVYYNIIIFVFEYNINQIEPCKRYVVLTNKKNGLVANVDNFGTRKFRMLE